MPGRPVPRKGTWKRIEVVVTSRTRNAVVREGTWVRIPPLPPKKHLNFDTMGIKIAVLSFCLNGLISRAFRLLRCLLLPGRTIARRQSSAQRHRMAVGYRLFLGLPFNLWAIVYLPNSNDSNSMKHIKITGNILKTASESAIIKMVFYTL